jgi:hypothetical protein
MGKKLFVKGGGSGMDNKICGKVLAFRFSPR